MRKNIIFLMIIAFLSISAYADNYDTARQIHELSKQVDSYQKSMMNGTYQDYSKTPAAVNFFWSLIGIGLLAGMGWVASFAIKSASVKTKRILLIFIAAIVLLIFWAYILDYTKKISIEKREVEHQRSIAKTIEEYKILMDSPNENLKKILNGVDPRFAAGAKIYNEITKIPETEVVSPNSSKYKLISCLTIRKCDFDLITKDHPLNAEVWEYGLYFCRKDKTDDFQLTGLFINYGSRNPEYHDAAMSFIENAKLTQELTPRSGNTPIKTKLISSEKYDFTRHTIVNGKGISFIWSTQQRNIKIESLDMCGNDVEKGYADYLY